MGRHIVIIGGGASGFFAAINTKEKYPKHRVTLLEKSNKLLAKVSVSGGGRCNVTHACFDNRELVLNYPRGQQELKGPLSRFSVGDLIAWFSDRGVELKMEEDGRMFPISDQSQSIVDCFLKEADRLGVEIRLQSEVEEIQHDGIFQVQIKNAKPLQADALVVAIGGNPKMKHYQWLETLGHEIVPPIPSLFTFNLPKHASNALMGLSVPASVKLLGSKYEEYGPVLFTHWGMSGPAILKLSSKGARLLNQKEYQFEYEVCWLDNALDFVEEQRNINAAKKINNARPEAFPSRLWAYFVERAELGHGKNWADLNRAEMERLIQVLSKDVYQAQGKTTFKEEFVTCGGVKLQEIDMKNMESKLVPHLYLCGEVIDVDALTGGFNFQAAWTGGWLVSESLARLT